MIRSFLWRSVTLALMIAGYAGYYLCRSNFSVAAPMLIQEMGSRGIPASVATVQLGAIASWGVLAYALGKFPSGWLADFLGGRRNFLCGMGGSVIFTVMFALGGGIPVFTLACFGNRLVQSLGWTGMVKISSRWFSYSEYGAAMGLISLSYLFGDAASRQFMSVLISHGLGWRGVFFAAAAVLAVLLLLNLIFLREAPQNRGLPEPVANPNNLFHASGDAPRPENLRILLKRFAVSPVFWLVCLISLGLTLMRETFNFWTPMYFTQALGLTNADAAQKSALFPLFGGVSVVLAGFLSDKLGPKGRAFIIFVGLLFTSGLLLALALLRATSSAGVSTNLRVWLVALVAFAMLGPYSYFAGAISLDFGGKQGSATASGWIDGLSYLGGVMAGSSMANVTVSWGWRGTFAVLAGISLLSSCASGVYLYLQPQKRSI